MKNVSKASGISMNVLHTNKKRNNYGRNVYCFWVVLASLHAAFIFGLLLRKAVRSGLRAFKAFLRCLEPLRSKVGGASKPCAMFCGMGPPGDCSLQFIIYN